MSLLLQSIILAPSILWQALFQPSKIPAFAAGGAQNEKKITLAGLWWGMFFGTAAGFGHYALYGDLKISIFFAAAVAVAFAVAFAGAFALAFAGAFAVAFAGMLAAAGAFTSAFADGAGAASTGVATAAFAVAVAFAGMLAVTDAVADAVTVAVSFFIFLLSGAGFVLGSFFNPVIVPVLLSIFAGCWLLIALKGFDKIKLAEFTIAGIFFLSLFCAGLAGGAGLQGLRPMETLLWPVSFLFGYFFAGQFDFVSENRKYQKNREEKTGVQGVGHRAFARNQKGMVLLAPLVGLLLFALTSWEKAAPYQAHLKILAPAFALIPVFILHLPDYLLCLPVWAMQRRHMAHLTGKTRELQKAYRGSLLFTHEMLYFPLPGLNRIISLLAQTREIGIPGAVAEINRLYAFSFQHKQAEKAVIRLAEDKQTAHQYIHFLLAEKNIPLLRTLAAANPVAQFYLALLDPERAAPSFRTGGHTHRTDLLRHHELFAYQKSFLSFLTPRRSKQTSLAAPHSLKSRLVWVLAQLQGLEGYRFNDEICDSLAKAHRWLTAEQAGTLAVGPDQPFPPATAAASPYLAAFAKLMRRLVQITGNLAAVTDTERFETRRDLLSDKMAALKALARELTFDPPFDRLWYEALLHGAALLEREIELFGGSARPVIHLRNTTLLTSPESQKLFFSLENEGRAPAEDLCVSFDPLPEPLGPMEPGPVRLPLLETGTTREVVLILMAPRPAALHLSGKLIFRDRTGTEKTLPFSFALQVRERPRTFKKITPNPYIAGNPLSAKSALYFGREDAYKYIDEHILSGDTINTIVCYGLRRTGKSSLLKRIAAVGLSDTRLVPVYLDMQGVDDEADFYDSLARTVARGLGLEPPEQTTGFGPFKSFLRLYLSKAGNKLPIVLFDEFEELQMRVESGKMTREVFSHLRHLMQHQQGLAFLFCGTHLLEEMKADYWSIFFNTATYLRISFLSEVDTRRLIREPVAGRMSYDDLAADHIFKMTGGQPYLTQLTCSLLVDYLNIEQRNDAGINDVDVVVARLIEEDKDQFSIWLWEQARPLERLVLAACAEEMGEKLMETVAFSNLYNRVLRVDPKLTRKACADTLDRLVNREVLHEREARYRFSVNLFRQWIAQKHPLYKLKDSYEP